MSRSLRAETTSLLLTGVVLAAQLCAAGPGVLCLGDAAPDCCPAPSTDRTAPRDTQPLVDRGPCDCCLTVEASAASVRAPSTSDGLAAALSAPTLHVATSLNVRADRASARYRLDAGLSSLRTIVLLV